MTLAGCPLEEKISEMNLVKARGYSLGALAIVAVDNPMCAATGHRICNDCMKACIYQKQEPVDIPQVETRTLKDVLALPWGFEIYCAPDALEPAQPAPAAAAAGERLQGAGGRARARPGSPSRIILINDGHTVAAIDGLKIEPLPAEISGVAADGSARRSAPIRDVGEPGTRVSTTASWPASAASPNTASPCAGTRIS